MVNDRPNFIPKMTYLPLAMKMSTLCRNKFCWVALWIVAACDSRSPQNAPEINSLHQNEKPASNTGQSLKSEQRFASPPITLSKDQLQQQIVGTWANIATGSNWKTFNMDGSCSFSYSSEPKALTGTYSIVEGSRIIVKLDIDKKTLFFHPDIPELMDPQLMYKVKIAEAKMILIQLIPNSGNTLSLVKLLGPLK